jgi:RNA polymerase sigma factor (sigma-70 family)
LEVSFTLTLCPGPPGEYYAAGRDRDWSSIRDAAQDVELNVEPSDESLLAGFATGDPRTAAAFVRRFQGRVYGLALTIVRQPAVAEEVAQETFVRVYRHAGNYDARKGRVSTWMLSIARNLAIDVTRMRRFDPVDPEVIAGELSMASSSPGIDEMAVQPDERDRLRTAIGDLPDDQRSALVQAAYMGRTAQEISSLDQVPLGTVKTRIRTAMLKLRSELEVED